MPGKSRLRFSSILDLTYRDQVEKAVFFNPEQHLVVDAVLACVKKYGVPELIEDGPSLRFSVPAFKDVQSLYALDDQQSPAAFAGVAIFVRDSVESMLILHLALDEAYGVSGPERDERVATRLITAVRAICLHTRGITSLRVLYPRETVFTIRP